ncbi:MAG: Two component transcriptional regulator, CheY family [Solirubrobacterales bacterium]|nr:Two component transcriptional regulator, CheY family [Solirubrobacterales bacterium]
MPLTGSEHPARIVIAHESAFVQAGLRAALESGGMVVVAVCGDADDTHVTAMASRPNAVLLSADLPGGAEETIGRIRAERPDIEFVVLADDADEASMLRMVAAGAHGILLGASDPARLPHAVAGVLNGESAFPRRLVRAMADELARRHRHQRGHGATGIRLTTREFEVLESLAEGGPVHDVARRLDISPATVRRHAANATRKLGAADRAEALRIVRGELARSEAG